MLIDYSHVTIFQGDLAVLRDVSFSAAAGDFIYLIGKVGSGKSSLLKTMYAELELTGDGASSATVLGRNMLRLRRKEVPALRREMGIIFQDFQLLHDRSVYQNLRFVLRATGWRSPAEIDERIDAVLDKVGMMVKKHAMPHALSGGEQQRIAIARALLNTPQVLLADEPTGNLDPATATQIVCLLHDICATGTAVVMSTHNWSMLDAYPGRVYRCSNGKVREVQGALDEEEEEEEEEATLPIADEDEVLAGTVAAGNEEDGV